LSRSLHCLHGPRAHEPTLRCHASSQKHRHALAAAALTPTVQYGFIALPKRIGIAPFRVSKLMCVKK
jgi:hypothetical protein